MWFGGGENPLPESAWHFKTRVPEPKRMAMSRKLKDSHPDRIGVIVEVIGDGLSINSNKFLAPTSGTLSRLLIEIRRSIQLHGDTLPETVAIFLLVGENNVLAPTSYTIEQIYKRYCDKDGLLYFKVATENTFG